jgi:DNA-binding winged helix-turn-helix (wHTH) protein
LRCTFTAAKADPALEPIASASAASRTCRFGEFELNPATRELRRGGERVDLQPKVFDRIAYLLEQRAWVVDKDELLQAVWPRSC